MPESATAPGVIFYEVIEANEVDAESGTEPVTPQGQTLTLLHNFMSSGRAAWGPLLPELSKHYRLLLPDLPGHGRSLGQPAGYEHHAIACQLAALLHAEGAENGNLAGCSSGGMLAQLLVHHRLVAPATLTLVSTTYSVNPADNRQYARRDARALPSCTQLDGGYCSLARSVPLSRLL